MRTLQIAKPPMHGPDVRELQTLLRTHGWHGDADGVYGVATGNEVYRRKVTLGYAKPDHAAGDLFVAYLAGKKKPTAAMVKRAKGQPKLGPTTSANPATLSREDTVRAKCVSIAHFLVAHSSRIHYPPGDRRTTSRIHLISTMAELETALNQPGGLTLDCSQTVSLIAHLAGAKCPDGSYAANWAADGYTGTLLAGCERISASQAKPGDPHVYGGGTGHHVAMSVGGGLMVSHGSDPIRFISDAAEVAYQPAGGAWLRLPI